MKCVNYEASDFMMTNLELVIQMVSSLGQCCRKRGVGSTLYHSDTCSTTSTPVADLDIEMIVFLREVLYLVQTLSNMQ